MVYAAQTLIRFYDNKFTHCIYCPQETQHVIVLITAGP